jgi:hypothetical protein
MKKNLHTRSHPPHRRCHRSWSWSLEGAACLSFAASDALLGAVGDDAGRCLPITAWGHLPTSLGGAKHDSVVAGGALGGAAAQLLERVPEEVAMSALPWALPTALGQGAHATRGSPCRPCRLG